jgi:NAD(P)-dependent dehydrogenase (short-subunit alcohol dehydrogenase family)
MTSRTTSVVAQREPELAGQTVVVIGGSAGIGLETARRARAEGADVVITGRNLDRLTQAAQDVGAQRTAAFDANDTAALQSFFSELPAPIDHVMVTAGGPRYGPLLQMNSAQVRDAVSEHLVLALEVAPIRVNLIAAGFVDTPLSAALLGDRLEERRNELRATLPIGRVVGPADVAALAVHIMSNTALTGATYDIDGGQQFVT